MPSDIIPVLILALIQGLTEFLPVSSSGHLVIAESLLRSEFPGADGSIIFEIAVHIGTLGAVILFYRERVSRICAALWIWAVSGFRISPRVRPELEYSGWIVLGSIPAAIVGIAFHDRIASAFDSPVAASLLLVLTGMLLYLSRGRKGGSDFSWKAVAAIGLAQAVAVLPGCSRSGWTITAALMAGIGFEKAAEFSFMLSIPAVLGALLLELVKNTVPISPAMLALLALGAAGAFVSGLVALKILIGSLRRGYFHRFSWYLVPAGIAAFVYFSLAG